MGLLFHGGHDHHSLVFLLSNFQCWDFSKTILDDRDLRPGFKFKDSELVGFPVRVGIGSKSLDQGNVELTLRSNGQRESVPISQATAKVKSALADV